VVEGKCHQTYCNISLRKFLGAIAAIAPKMSILQHILDVAKAPKSCSEYFMKVNEGNSSDKVYHEE
jgi:hypothetical protein